MGADPILLTTLAVAIVANALLLVALPVRARIRRPTTDPPDARPRPDGPRRIRPGDPAAASPANSTDRSDAGVAPAARADAGVARANGAAAADDRTTALAIEAFIRATRADPATTVASAPHAGIAPATATPGAATPIRPDGVPDVSVSAAHPGPQAGPSDWAPDALTDPRAWARAMDRARHAARTGRRPALVTAELDRLDHVADRLGRQAVNRILEQTARLLIEQARPTDHIAWLGGATFGILLAEVDEPVARAYADRARAVCDGWLHASGLAVRIRFELVELPNGE